MAPAEHDRPVMGWMEAARWLAEACEAERAKPWPIRDAADECQHGRLPGDRTPPCGCFEVAA